MDNSPAAAAIGNLGTRSSARVRSKPRCFWLNDDTRDKGTQLLEFREVAERRPSQSAVKSSAAGISDDESPSSQPLTRQHPHDQAKPTPQQGQHAPSAVTRRLSKSFALDAVPKVAVGAPGSAQPDDKAGRGVPTSRSTAPQPTSGQGTSRTPRLRQALKAADVPPPGETNAGQHAGSKTRPAGGSPPRARKGQLAGSSGAAANPAELMPPPRSVPRGRPRKLAGQPGEASQRAGPQASSDDGNSAKTSDDIGATGSGHAPMQPPPSARPGSTVVAASAPGTSTALASVAASPAARARKPRGDPVLNAAIMLRDYPTAGGGVTEAGDTEGLGSAGRRRAPAQPPASAHPGNAVAPVAAAGSASAAAGAGARGTGAAAAPAASAPAARAKKPRGDPVLNSTIMLRDYPIDMTQDSSAGDTPGTLTRRTRRVAAAAAKGPPQAVAGHGDAGGAECGAAGPGDSKPGGETVPMIYGEAQAEQERRRHQMQQHRKAPAQEVQPGAPGAGAAAGGLDGGRGTAVGEAANPKSSKAWNKAPMKERAPSAAVGQGTGAGQGQVQRRQARVQQHARREAAGQQPEAGHEADVEEAQRPRKRSRDAEPRCPGPPAKAAATAEPTRKAGRIEGKEVGDKVGLQEKSRKEKGMQGVVANAAGRGQSQAPMAAPVAAAAAAAPQPGAAAAAPALPVAGEKAQLKKLPEEKRKAKHPQEERQTRQQPKENPHPTPGRSLAAMAALAGLAAAERGAGAPVQLPRQQQEEPGQQQHQQPQRNEPAAGLPGKTKTGKKRKRVHGAPQPLAGAAAAGGPVAAGPSPPGQAGFEALHKAGAAPLPDQTVAEAAGTNGIHNTNMVTSNIEDGGDGHLLKVSTGTGPGPVVAASDGQRQGVSHLVHRQGLGAADAAADMAAATDNGTSGSAQGRFEVEIGEAAGVRHQHPAGPQALGSQVQQQQQQRQEERSKQRQGSESARRSGSGAAAAACDAAGPSNPRGPAELPRASAGQPVVQDDRFYDEGDVVDVPLAGLAAEPEGDLGAAHADHCLPEQDQQGQETAQSEADQYSPTKSVARSNDFGAHWGGSGGHRAGHRPQPQSVPQQRRPSRFYSEREALGSTVQTTSQAWSSAPMVKPAGSRFLGGTAAAATAAVAGGRDAIGSCPARLAAQSRRPVPPPPRFDADLPPPQPLSQPLPPAARPQGDPAGSRGHNGQRQAAAAATATAAAEAAPHADSDEEEDYEDDGAVPRFYVRKVRYDERAPGFLPGGPGSSQPPQVRYDEPRPQPGGDAQAGVRTGSGSLPHQAASAGAAADAACGSADVARQPGSRQGGQGGSGALQPHTRGSGGGQEGNYKRGGSQQQRKGHSQPAEAGGPVLAGVPGRHEQQQSPHRRPQAVPTFPLAGLAGPGQGGGWQGPPDGAVLEQQQAELQQQQHREGRGRPRIVMLGGQAAPERDPYDMGCYSDEDQDQLPPFPDAHRRPHHHPQQLHQQPHLQQPQQLQQLHQQPHLQQPQQLQQLHQQPHLQQPQQLQQQQPHQQHDHDLGARALHTWQGAGQALAAVAAATGPVGYAAQRALQPDDKASRLDDMNQEGQEEEEKDGLGAAVWGSGCVADETAAALGQHRAGPGSPTSRYGVWSLDLYAHTPDAYGGTRGGGRQPGKEQLGHPAATAMAASGSLVQGSPQKVLSPRSAPSPRDPRSWPGAARGDAAVPAVVSAGQQRPGCSVGASAQAPSASAGRYQAGFGHAQGHHGYAKDDEFGGTEAVVRDADFMEVDDHEEAVRDSEGDTGTSAQRQEQQSQLQHQQQERGKGYQEQEPQPQRTVGRPGDYGATEQSQSAGTGLGLGKCERGPEAGAVPAAAPQRQAPGSLLPPPRPQQGQQQPAKRRAAQVPGVGPVPTAQGSRAAQAQQQRQAGPQLALQQPILIPTLRPGVLGQCGLKQKDEGQVGALRQGQQLQLPGRGVAGAPLMRPVNVNSMFAALKNAEQAAAQRSKGRMTRIAEREEDGWTLEQVQALQNAYHHTDPQTPNFWKVVAARVPGRTASECYARVFGSAGNKEEQALLRKLLPRGYNPAAPATASTGNAGRRGVTVAAARKWSQKMQDMEQLQRLVRLAGDDMDLDGPRDQDDDSSSSTSEGPSDEEGQGDQPQGSRAGSSRVGGKRGGGGGGRRGQRRRENPLRRAFRVLMEKDPDEARRILEGMQTSHMANRYITSFLSKQGGWAKWQKAARNAQTNPAVNNNVPGAQAAAGAAGAGGQRSSQPQQHGVTSGAAAAAGPQGATAAGAAGPAARAGRTTATGMLADCIRRVLAREDDDRQREAWREEDELEGVMYDDGVMYDEGDEASSDEKDEDAELEQLLIEEGIIDPGSMPLLV